MGRYAAGAFPFFTDMDVRQYSRSLSAAGRQTAGQPVLVIGLNEDKTVGRTTIIYRGLESGSRFRLYVIIPELDPEVAYPHHMSKSEAKQGFRLANESFQLLTVRKRYISLMWLKPQHVNPQS
jgi:hypothetical protein